MGMENGAGLALVTMPFDVNIEAQRSFGCTIPIPFGEVCTAPIVSTDTVPPKPQAASRMPRNRRQADGTLCVARLGVRATLRAS